MKLKSSHFFSFFILTLVFMNFTTFTAHDLGWHLKTGEWICQNLQIPKYDIYSYTSSDYPWIDLHWGFQILIHGVFLLGSQWGLSILKIALLILIYLIFYRRFGRKDIPLTTSFILLLSSLTAHERFQLRPELLTFLFMIIDLAILETERLRKNKFLWIILPVQVLWTNVEGLFMIGPALILIYLLGEILEGKKPCRLMLLFPLALLASLINPYGIQGLLFPFTLLSEIAFKGNNPFQLIGEFHSPLAGTVTQSAFVWFFYILLGLSTISCLLNLRRTPKVHLILLFTFATLAFLAQRNIALFSFVGAFVLLKNWPSSSFPRLRIGNWIGFLTYSCTSLFLIFGSFSNWIYIKDSRLDRFGLGVAPEIFPEKAIRHLKNDVIGPLFNSIDFGPALIYLAWPQLKPFIDTRLEVYGSERLGEYKTSFEQKSKWNEVVQKYGIKTVFLDHFNKNSLQLITQLSQDPDWGLTYFDETAAIFIKREGKKIEVIDGRNQNQRKPTALTQLQKLLPWFSLKLTFPYESIYSGRLFLALGKDNEAEQEYLKVSSVLPQYIEAWINLAYIEEKRGNFLGAIQFLQEGLKKSRNSYQAHFNLGNLYFKLNHYEDAAQEFQKAFKVRPTPQAEHNLAIAKKYSKTKKGP